MIKAVGFDIGHTLIKYDNPLNLSSVYHSALKEVFINCNIEYSSEKIEKAIAVLTKYNTRINSREIEVSSDTIFGEILSSLSVDLNLIYNAKSAFFSFIQATAVPFCEVETVLQKMKFCNIKIGVLTNVAYGMDNQFSLRDIAELTKYFDMVLTSVDVGFRKPNSAGFKMLLNAFDIQPHEMLYVGDEEIDIIGANSLGIGSVLINRNDKVLNFGQKYTINSLNQLMDIL